MVWLSFLINLLLRFIYAAYGYIANEEGMLLYNQKLAYSGQIPFIDYDAWSSLFHDYLLGWHQLIFGTSIFTQRLIGIWLTSVVFWLTVKISQRLAGLGAATWTAVLLALGSIRYVYLSTIPASETFMTLAIVLSLTLILSRRFLAALVLAASASLIRSQALPATMLIYIYVFTRLPFSQSLRLTLASLVIALAALLPWLVKDPARIVWAFFWPLQADQILLYQQGTGNLTLSHLVNFGLEISRDYGLLFALTLASLISGLLHSLKSKTKLTFMWLLLAIIASQLFVALAHRPPYASYVYPFVPLLAIIAGFILNRFLSQLSRLNRRFFYLFVYLVLLLNLGLFPHAQFMKTSVNTITTTPHKLLANLTTKLTESTRPHDTILAFYVPPVVMSGRNLPLNLNRGPFSISLWDTLKASKHHLASLAALRDYISSRQAAAIITTDRTPRVLGLTPEAANSVTTLINQHYILAEEFDDISGIEDPKTKKLYFYLRRQP